jgi:hypothetical protein
VVWLKVFLLFHQLLGLLASGMARFLAVVPMAADRTLTVILRLVSITGRMWMTVTRLYTAHGRLGRR